MERTYENAAPALAIRVCCIAELDTDTAQVSEEGHWTFA